MSVFGRLCRKMTGGGGGGEKRGLGPRNDVFTSCFIRFSLARTFFLSRPPVPKASLQLNN